MKLVYMGTPQFAVAPLRALAASGHEIIGVVTRIDKPSGRGQVLASPPVKQAASEMKLPLFQPRRVREPEFIAMLKSLNAEVIVVAAYGQILPNEILTLPKYGCINIHASLLPLYRGAAPINWAIMHGDAETGITIMQMDEGMDTGAMLLQESIPIGSKDTAGSMLEKLSSLGARLITEALPLIAAGRIARRVQDNRRATLAPPLRKKDGSIDWTLPAVEIHNRVRGLSPWPGAYTYLDGKMIKILESEAMTGKEEPGVLFEAEKGALAVGAGSGILRIVALQSEGKKPMTAADFLRGHHGLAGKKLSEKE
ncbi:MAG TPA: methionyl-tRNA formyltransferase [Nitrospirota bacterium]|nr:methionyl-tRNA formyltransferase [Nitrospirota bacterium]